MIQNCPRACFIPDKKGLLPAHVGCSRHCTEEKLELLLSANPASLFAETNDGRSLLEVAKTTATKAHPNLALIGLIERKIKSASTMAASPSLGMGQSNPQAGLDHSKDDWNQDTADLDSHTGSAMDGIVPINCSSSEIQIL